VDRVSSKKEGKREKGNTADNPRAFSTQVTLGEVAGEKKKERGTGGKKGRRKGNILGELFMAQRVVVAKERCARGVEEGGRNRKKRGEMEEPK